MIIRAGYAIAFECAAVTPMILHLNIHPSRAGDLISPDVVRTEPDYPTGAYLDLFGNRVTRVEAQPGVVTFHNDFTIRDSGSPDEKPEDAPLTPIARLPSDVLVYLLASRYCDSDNLSDFAWSQFAGIAGGARLVQVVCDFVNSRIRFDYAAANPGRTASDGLREGVGVCRDFAHLAAALCRAMNVPARYCTGYLGDIGVPPDPAPMDFSAWFEVFLNGRWYTFDARHNIHRIGRIVMARGHCPDLIIMDIQLPDMSGLEVTRAIKGDPALAGIPLLAVTAYAMNGDEDNCRAAGCDAGQPEPAVGIDRHPGPPRPVACLQDLGLGHRLARAVEHAPRHHAQRFGERRGKVELLHVELHAPGFDLRHVQDVVDHLEEVMAAGQDVVAIFLIFLRAERAEHAAFHDFREADDGVQRRAQLVAHIGEEF